MIKKNAIIKIIQNEFLLSLNIKSLFLMPFVLFLCLLYPLLTLCILHIQIDGFIYQDNFYLTLVIALLLCHLCTYKISKFTKLFRQVNEEQSLELYVSKCSLFFYRLYLESENHAKYSEFNFSFVPFRMEIFTTA